MPIFSKRRPRGRPSHPDILTPAEWRVLEPLRTGRTNQEIADQLGLSHNTVKTHVSNMLAKLELEHRHELAAWHGAPAEASRAVPRRLSLAVPWVGRSAAIGGAVVAAALFVFAMQAMNQSGSSTGASALAPTASATEAPTEETPVETIGDPGRFPTGLPPVDETAVDVIDGDLDAMVARMEYDEAVCSSEDRPSYEWRCEDLGLPPGSIFSGLPTGGCDVTRTPIDSVPVVVGPMLEALGRLELWSIFEPMPQTTVTPATLALTFAAVSADGSGRVRPVLQVSMRDEAIVAMFRTSCLDDVPTPDLVSKWIVHPADLGHPVSATP